MTFRILYYFLMTFYCIHAIDTDYDFNLNDLQDDEFEVLNDKTFGEINITNISACSLNISWDCLYCKEDIVDLYTVYWISSSDSEDNFKSENVSSDTLYYTISDLVEKTEYDVSVTSHIFGLKKKHEFTIGSDTVNTTDGEPSDVTGLNYTEITSSKIYLAWDETTNVCPIKGYKIEYNGTVLWKVSTLSQTDTSTKNSYTLSNLTPYTSYTISVREVTTYDEEGLISVLEDVVTLEDVADPPEDVTASAKSAYSIEVNWNEPQEKNGIITEYLVSWQIESDGDSNDIEEWNTTDTTYTAENLLACGDYVFTITAINGAGFGEPATKDQSTQPEPTPPVTNLTYSDETSESVYLTWIPPDTNCPVLNYTIEGTEDILWSEDSDKVDVSFDGGNSSYVLEGLTPYTGYNISIKAETEGGIGDSDFVYFETLEDVPSAPTNVKAIAGKTKVTVSWSNPEELNGEITSYNVEWLLNGEQEGSEDLEGDVYHYIIQDLLPCLTYDINVSASTSAGKGPSEQKSVTLISEVPPPPENLKCIATGSSSISLQWNPPDTSCDVNLYEITGSGDILWNEENSSLDTNTSSTNCSINNLVPYTSYNVSVKAILNQILEGKSAFCIVETAEDIPGRPENLTVVEGSREKESFKISWLDPTEKNGKLKEYLIKKDNSDYKTVSASSTGQYEETINDLKHGTNYSITVYAQTSEGYGNYSQLYEKTDDGSNAGIIVGSIFAVLIVLAAVGFGYYYRKDIKKKLKKSQSSPSTD